MVLNYMKNLRYNIMHTVMCYMLQKITINNELFIENACAQFPLSSFGGELI